VRGERERALSGCVEATETEQQTIQIWLELDQEDPGFQFLTEENNAAITFLRCIS
jgi:hypothetical protein